MLLPVDRPVLHSDILAFAEKSGLFKYELAALLALNGQTWNRLNRVCLAPFTRDLPVRDHRVALLIRYLFSTDLKTVRLPVMHLPICQIYDALKSSIGPKLTKSRFALTLGTDPGQASKWSRRDLAPNPQSARLATLLASDPEPLLNNWRKLEDIAVIEARARGVDDILQTRSWKS